MFNKCSIKNGKMTFFTDCDVGYELFSLPLVGKKQCKINQNESKIINYGYDDYRRDVQLHGAEWRTK